MARIDEEFSVHPAVALRGPRQCGKTALARAFAADRPGSVYFDLEDPADRRRLEAPKQALSGLSGLVVIDGIERMRSLLELLRALLDRPSHPARFLLLESASPMLAREPAESLAGRVGLVDVAGFDLAETGPDAWRILWQRGSLPRSFLAATDRESRRWRRAFVRAFVERDVLQMGIAVSSQAIEKFWTTVAHRHGQVWNASELARSLGSGPALARKYLDILAAAFTVRALPPWYENLKKRQVKAPRVYVRDSGLLHTLLGVDQTEAVMSHPKAGASFAGFVIEQLAVAFESMPFFWATHAGAELDLLVHREGRRYGFDCTLADAPRTTKSMRSAIRDLRLDHLWVVYPGDEEYALDDGIEVLPVAGIPRLTKRLGARRPTGGLPFRPDGSSR